MRIAGIGAATPPHDVDQRAAAAYVSGLRGSAPRDTRRLDALYRRSGIQRRGSVLLEPDGDGNPRVPLLEADPGTEARMEAYELLASLKSEGESFSKVIKKNFRRPRSMERLMEAVELGPPSEEMLDTVDAMSTKMRKEKPRMV